MYKVELSLNIEFFISGSVRLVDFGDRGHVPGLPRPGQRLSAMILEAAEYSMAGQL